MAPGGDAYEALGSLYDVWCESVVEDLDFYLEACAGADGPIVELGCRLRPRRGAARARGTSACAGSMPLPRCSRWPAARAEEAGVSERIELSLGDLTDPPASLGPAARVLVPFRPYLHLVGDGERLRALRGARELLAPAGRLVFDVFEPTAADIRKTHDRWIEREAGIWERARWNAAERTIELAVRARGRIVEMRLEWRSSDEWRALCAAAGLESSRPTAGSRARRSTGSPETTSSSASAPASPSPPGALAHREGSSDDLRGDVPAGDHDHDGPRGRRDAPGEQRGEARCCCRLGHDLRAQGEQPHRRRISSSETITTSSTRSRTSS